MTVSPDAGGPEGRRAELATMREAAELLGRDYFRNVVLSVCHSALEGRETDLRVVEPAFSGQDPGTLRLLRSGPAEEVAILAAVVAASKRPGGVTPDAVDAELAEVSGDFPRRDLRTYLADCARERDGMRPDGDAAFWLEHYGRAGALRAAIDSGAHVEELRPAFGNGVGPAAALEVVRSRQDLKRAEADVRNAERRQRTTRSESSEGRYKYVTGGAMLGMAGGLVAYGLENPGMVVGLAVNVVYGAVSMGDAIRRSVAARRAKSGWNAADGRVLDARRTAAEALGGYNLTVGTVSPGHLHEGDVPRALPPSTRQPDRPRRGR